MSISGIDTRSALRKRSNSRSYSQRIDVRDPQAVGDEAAGGAAAARADGDAVLLGEADEVPDDQEVGVEAHVVDDAELHLHALDRLGGRRVAVALAQAGLDELAAGTRARPCRPGSRSAGSAGCRARSRRCSARRSPAWSATACGMSANDSAISSVDFRKNSFVVEAHLRLRERRLRLHAQQRGVVVEVLAAEVVHVGGRDQRPAHLLARSAAIASLTCSCSARPLRWTSK